MKKVLIFSFLVIILFAAVAFLSNLQKEKNAENNPYGKDSLHPETADQLDDPNYKNIILPEKLEEKLENKENVTVYFYSPTCPHCVRTTPIVAPLSTEMGIDLVQYNLLEFEQGWDLYDIEETPTIVQFKDGKEVKRIIGYNEEEVFINWFTKYSLVN